MKRLIKKSETKIKVMDNDKLSDVILNDIKQLSHQFEATENYNKILNMINTNFDGYSKSDYFEELSKFIPNSYNQTDLSDEVLNDLGIDIINKPYGVERDLDNFICDMFMDEYILEEMAKIFNFEWSFPESFFNSDYDEYDYDEYDD